MWSPDSKRSRPVSVLNGEPKEENPVDSEGRDVGGYPRRGTGLEDDGPGLLEKLGDVEPGGDGKEERTGREDGGQEGDGVGVGPLPERTKRDQF